MLNLLRCVGYALAKQGLGGIAVAVAEPSGVGMANLIGQVGAEAFKEWRAGRKQDQLHADILEVAKVEFAEAKVVAVEIAREVAPGDAELAEQVERFVTLIPASIRASLRRPEDLTGTTLPAGYALHEPDDLARLLPVRLSRFKAGDTPDFLRGWELVEQIGAGGFGEVWKARNRRVQGLIDAVKFGHALSETEHALLNEGDVIGRLMADGGHPGVVALRDAWTETDATPWLRYEYVPGGDLAGLIHRWQTRPAADRLTIALAALRELAGTVGHFHRLPGGPVVHRDLKPSNILVAADGRLKVGDFGIGAVSARRSLAGERDGTVSRGGRLQSYLRGSHTPLYASPQQRAGGRDLDPRDDVHALGVIAYQMLTGLLDHGAGPDFADDLREFGAGEQVVALLTRCVAAKAERRPKDAQELADGLAALNVGSEITQVAVPRPTAPAVTTVRQQAAQQLQPAATFVQPGKPMSALALAVELRTLKGHTSSVVSVAFSPDGRLLATAGDTTARIWDTATGVMVRELTRQASEINCVAFSPDGRLVATAGADMTARLWEVATGQQIQTFAGHTHYVLGVAFSPDGRLVATAGADKTARLWEVATGQQIQTFAGHTQHLCGVAFSPDGQLLATGSQDTTARLWDTVTGQQVLAFKGHREGLTGVAFSPDGRLVASASLDGTARLWDASNGRNVHTLSVPRGYFQALTEHTSNVNSVAFSSDGRLIATASDDYSARLWDVATGRQIQNLTGHSHYVRSVAFSPDGRLLATASDDMTARLWQLGAAGEPSATPPTP